MKNRNWFWGFFFLLIAVFIIGTQIDAFGEIGTMTILATAILAALVIHSIFRRNFFGVFIPFAFLYMIYWEPLNLVEISAWKLFLAAVLVSIGFSILFGSRSSRVTFVHNVEKNYKHGHKSYDHTSENIDDNNPYVKVNFGASSKYLHADCLRGGQFIASFGALELYFDQVQLSPEGAEINIDCSFGAIEIYVPRHWKVQEKIRTTLGGVEHNAHGASPAADAPCLTIKGNVSFGGVEIRYI